MELAFAQRAMRPVGEARGLVEARPGEPPDERFVARRIAEAAHHRGDLGIEDRARHLSGQLIEDFKILPRRMKYLQGTGAGHQRQQRRQIDTLGERVDRDRLLRPGDLREAQDRPIGPLADEFSIDGDEFCAFLPLAEPGERVGVGDYRHLSRAYTENTPTKLSIRSNSRGALMDQRNNWPPAGPTLPTGCSRRESGDRSARRILTRLLPVDAAQASRRARAVGFSLPCRSRYAAVRRGR